MTESSLYPEIIGELSHGPVRLWRQQSMLAWAGKVIGRTATTLTLQNPHAVKVGMPGISDIGGLVSYDITPEDIGARFAVAVAIECKFGRRQTTNEQAAFIAMVQRMGGRAGVARSVADARRIVYG
jgi:hypothetical protein